MSPSSRESEVFMEENVHKFRIKDGQIIYLVGEGKFSSHLDNDWFGCSFCNRWFQHLRQLETHYGREHEGEDSYKFELLELRNCVISLPYIWCNNGVATYKVTNTSQSKMEPEKSLESGTLDEQPVPKPNLDIAERTKTLKRGIREAIKATEQEPGGGSSFKRIMAYLGKTQGLEGNKFEKRLRRTLERSVDLNKLTRRYSKGKTMYSLKKKCAGDKKEKVEKVEHDRKTVKHDARHLFDKQLKQLVRKLKPHGQVAPKKKMLGKAK